MIISYPTSASGTIVSFFLNSQEKILDLAYFALQEQPGDNLMVAISWAGYNGSYAIAAKPIKSLELHNTIIKFLIICVRSS